MKKLFIIIVLMTMLSGCFYGKLIKEDIAHEIPALMVSSFFVHPVSKVIANSTIKNQVIKSEENSCEYLSHTKIEKCNFALYNILINHI